MPRRPGTPSGSEGQGALARPHPLVRQLRFARAEFARALDGITDAEARRRFPPLNTLGWSVGHLAWQEQRHWLLGGRGHLLLPAIDARFASGAPASSPDLDAAWAAWRAITAAADPWLDGLTTVDLRGLSALPPDGDPPSTVGSLLLRTTYHYWLHTGENLAIRQLLGHQVRPGFVGDLDGEAPYRAE